MTDEQIIKALECCSGEADICKSTCPCYVANASCLKNMAKEALDLINRQKAEIERLQRAYAVYEEITGLKRAKSEAIKDFAERVKEKTLAMIWSPELFSTADYIECIDSLVKETVGEQ